MLGYLHQFILNWLFTLLVEVPVLVILSRRFFHTPRTDISLGKLVLGGIFASTLTIPWVWYVFPVFFYHSLSTAVAVGEIFAFMTEAVFYMFAFNLSARQAFTISFAANTSSFLLGQVVFHHG